MRDLRIQIAAFAVALGLGGLGGYAISATKTSPTATGTLAEGTKVVRRTVHAKRPKVKVKASGPPKGASTNSLSSAPISTGSSGSSSSGSGSGRPVQTGSSGSSGGGSSRPPVSTGSSGAGGGAGGGGEDGDGGGEHEGGD